MTSLNSKGISVLDRRMEFNERLTTIKADYNFKKTRLVERKRAVDQFDEDYKLYVNRSVALKYIILLSDDTTKVVRDYLENIINRALDVVFGKNRYRFYLNSDLEAQKIELVLSEYKRGMWNDLDITLNVGDGMGQVIAFLYSIVLTEITNHRMLFIEDEILGGLHQEAVVFVKKCVREFAKHGAQFAIIEYTMEDFGLTYGIDNTSEGIPFIESVVKYDDDGNVVSSEVSE